VTPPQPAAAPTHQFTLQIHVQRSQRTECVLEIWDSGGETSVLMHAARAHDMGFCEARMPPVQVDLHAEHRCMLGTNCLPPSIVSRRSRAAARQRSGITHLRAGFRERRPHDQITVHVDDHAVARPLVHPDELAAVHDCILQSPLPQQ